MNNTTMLKKIASSIKELQDIKYYLVNELISEGITAGDLLEYDKVSAIMLYRRQNDCTLDRAKDWAESFNFS